MLSTRLCLAGAAALCALAPAGADAAVGVTGFTLTPSTPQAGAAPSVTINASFAPTSGDDPQSVTLSLAPGLLANPTVPATCTETQLQGNACPAAAKIGSGTVTATLAGLSMNSPASLYLVTPRSGEVGRAGVVVSTPLGAVTAEGPITIRTTPTVGANVTLSNLPRSIGSLPVTVTVTGMRLTMPGTINGKAFTRNPTSCASAVSGIAVTSYNAPTIQTVASSAFTPTGCASLPYAPALSGTAAVSGFDGDTALTSTITQASGQAATRSATLTTPQGLMPRSDAATRACTASDPSSCPASATVGTATVSTPLLPGQLSGRVVLVASTAQLPSLAIVFPAPFGLTLTGTTSVTGGGTAIGFANLPDLPLSSLTVSFSGGSDSLLMGGYALCSGSPALNGTLTAQSAASASVHGPLTVSGCPV